MSLLDKAKKVPVANRRYSQRRDITDKDKIEIALAWLKGEVDSKQVSVALGRKVNNGSALYNMATWLRLAYKKGKLAIISGKEDK